MKNFFTAALIATAALCTVDAVSALNAKAADFCDSYEDGSVLCATRLGANKANLVVFENNAKTVDLDIVCTKTGADTFTYQWEGRSTYSNEDTGSVAKDFCDGFLF